MHIFLVNNYNTLALAENIIKNLKSDEYLLININEKLSFEKEHISIFISSLKNIFILYFKNLKNIKIVKNIIKTEKSNIYIPNIDNIFSNYLINLNKQNIQYHLLIEGMLCYINNSTHTQNKLLYYKKSIVAKFFLLNYSTMKCHISGIDHQKINYIHALSKIGLEKYNKKIIIHNLYQKSNIVLHKDKLLILGQHYYELINQNSYNSIIKKILIFIKENKFQKIYYKAHPLSTTDDPLLKNLSNVILIKENSLRAEEIVIKNSCGSVLSISSTALFNIKIFFPNTRCYSIGLNLLPVKIVPDKKSLIKLFTEIKIKVI